MTCSSTPGTAADPAVGRPGPVEAMLIDSYETPDAESLLLLGRERHSDGGAARRLLITEAAAAAIFIAAALCDGAARRLAEIALALGAGDRGRQLRHRSTGAASGRQRLDRPHAAGVRADAVRAPDPVRAADRRGVLGRRPLAGDRRRASRADAAAGGRRRQLLRARSGSRARPGRCADVLVAALADASYWRSQPRSRSTPRPGSAAPGLPKACAPRVSCRCSGCTSPTRACPRSAS